MSLSEEEEEEYTIINKDGVEVVGLIEENQDYYETNDEIIIIEEVKKRKNVIGQYYFVKIDKNIVDPSLKLKIEKDNKCLDRLNTRKAPLLLQFHHRNKNGPLIFRILHEDYCKNDMYWYYNWKSVVKDLEKHWPECIGEDPEQAIDPKIEMENIEKKIKELKRQLCHANHKLVEQKRILREIKDLEKQYDDISNDVKQAIARLPVPTRRWEHCPRDTKYDIQRRLREMLQYCRSRHKECKDVKPIPPGKNARTVNIDKQLRDINQEEEAIQNSINKTSLILNKQASMFDQYVLTIKNAKKLARKKDLEALAELSKKQVKGFMDEWKNDEAFRANYKRCTAKSLESRGLDKDGTLLAP